MTFRNVKLLWLDQMFLDMKHMIERTRTHGRVDIYFHKIRVSAKTLTYTDKK